MLTQIASAVYENQSTVIPEWITTTTCESVVQKAYIMYY